MDVPCAWVDQFGQRIYISAEQFFQSPVFQYFAHYLVLAFQLLKHLFRGDVLSCFCFLRFFNDFHFREEYFAHLFGRGDVERFAGQLVDVLFDVVHPVGEQS